MKRKYRIDITDITSGGSLESSNYIEGSTYVRVKRKDSNATSRDNKTRYGSPADSLIASTPSSRKQEKLLKINENLKKLG